MEGAIIALPPRAVSPHVDNITQVQDLDAAREVTDIPPAPITGDDPDRVVGNIANKSFFLVQNTDSNDENDKDMMDAGPVFENLSRDSSPGVTTQYNDRSKHSSAPKMHQQIM